jgi:hypothetical protein
LSKSLAEKEEIIADLRIEGESLSKQVPILKNQLRTNLSYN